MSTRFSTIRKILIATFMVAASSMQASDDRAETIGQSLICMCSCNQLLSGCEMINCSSAPPMRRELRKMVDQGGDDKTILASFAEKYGPKVLSAPPINGWFNISAWVMPFAVLFFGGLFTVFTVSRLRRRAAAAAPSSEMPAIDSSKYESEIEEELKKLNPED